MSTRIASMIIAFALSATASAATGTMGLKKGDIGLSVARAALVDAVARGNGTTDVTLVFSMNGCVDRLGPVFHTVEAQDDGSAVLKVSAVNISNEVSMRAMCIAIPTKSVTVNVKGSYTKDQLTVVALDATIPAEPVRPPVTCMAYWSGFAYDAATNTCQARGGSGCSNPFPYTSKEQCEAAHNL